MTYDCIRMHKQFFLCCNHASAIEPSINILQISNENGCSWHTSPIWSWQRRLGQVYRQTFILFHCHRYHWWYQKVHAILIGCCGPATFCLMKSLVFLDQLCDFSFAQLMEKEKLHREPKEKLHREPKVSIIVRWFQFNSRLCTLDESVADYVAALRRLAANCAFGDMLDEMLQDRVVCGMNNSTIQKRLLAQPELMSTKAVAVAQATEIADTGVKELQSSTVTASSVFPRKTRVYTNLLVLPQLSLQTIPAKSRNIIVVVQSTTLISVILSQRSAMPEGHIARVCWSKKKVQTTKTASSTLATNQMTELKSTDYTLFPVGCWDGKPLQTTVYVEDHTFVMEVDTEAALSLINESVYKSSPFLNKLPL